jgi:hypothetical protein
VERKKEAGMNAEEGIVAIEAKMREISQLAERFRVRFPHVMYKLNQVWSVLGNARDELLKGAEKNAERRLLRAQKRGTA